MNKLALTLGIATAALCGCVVQSLEPVAKPFPKGPAQYVPEGTVVNGTASEATMYDLESATQELLAKMRK